MDQAPWQALDCLHETLKGMPPWSLSVIPYYPLDGLFLDMQNMQILRTNGEVINIFSVFSFLFGAINCYVCDIFKNIDCFIILSSQEMDCEVTGICGYVKSCFYSV